MTGFAEGFASGYGLMDATLRNKREEELKQKTLDAENTKLANTADVENKKLGLESIKNDNEAKYHNDMVGIYKDHYTSEANNDKATAENQANKLKNEAIHTQNVDTLQAAQEKRQGLQEQRQKEESESTIKKNEAENALKEQQIWRAKQEDDFKKAALIGQTYLKPDGSLDGAAMVADPERAVWALDKLGHNVSHIATNPYLYHNSVQVLNNAFQNSDGKTHITEADNPEVLSAFGNVFGGQLNSNKGQLVEGKGRIVKTIPTEILSHQLEPTQDNPTGLVYTIGLKNVYEKDGKQYIDARSGPLTQNRSQLDSSIDPPRTFTAAQLHLALQANAQTIDSLITNPDVMAKWGKTFKDNAPKEDKEKEEKPINLKNGETAYFPDSKRSIGVDAADGSIKDSDTKKQEINAFAGTAPKPQDNSEPINPPLSDKARALMASETPSPGLSDIPSQGKPVTREEAIRRQQNLYNQNAEKRRHGLRGQLLTPEEIALQESKRK